jgi:CubicO group peptidase (beta-lactamase class C family)
MNTYLLSVIVSKVTKKTVAQYLDERVFRHLGIKEWIWEESPQGYSAGGWGLYIKAEDLAKFGLLWLNKGVWNGHRIIGEEWITEATGCHIIPHEGQCNGYGYQVWLYLHDSFRFHGSRGQIMMAIPEKNMILVATSAHNDDQRIIDSFFENFYNQLP